MDSRWGKSVPGRGTASAKAQKLENMEQLKSTGIDVAGATVVGPVVRNEHGEVARDHVKKKQKKPWASG